MSKFSEYIKEEKKKAIERFFGPIVKRSNQYFTFKRVIDEDNFIIITNNIKTIRGSPVLIIGPHEAVFLKDWQVVPVKMNRGTVNADAVKLNRNYFKIYTFKDGFNEYGGDGVESFDSLLEIAKEQDAANEAVAVGHSQTAYDGWED